MKLNFKTWGNLRIALLILAAYNILVIINIPQIYISNAQSLQPLEWWRPIAQMAFGYNIWAIVTPFILWLGWLFPITKPKFFHHFFFHFFIALCAGVFHHLAYNTGTWLIGLTAADSLQTNLFNTVDLIRFMSGTLVHYPVIIISQRAYLYFREAKERAFLLQQAELSALQAQLHPHFFFNTLNALSALIYRSPREADQMITRLGDLFRILLKKDKAQKISLTEEIEFLEAYLKIHQTLMGDRLKVEWKIAPETLDSKVPNLILQPLVENSVKHGLAPLEEGGTLEIGAIRQNGHLRLEVKDSGIGIKAGKNDFNKGIGLENTRSRLRHLYGDAHSFNIKKPSDGGGLSVVIKIPFQSGE